MLREMGKEGVMPTVDTFNTLMDACIRRVNPAAVPRLFTQMKQSGVYPLLCLPPHAQRIVCLYVSLGAQHCGVAEATEGIESALYADRLTLDHVSSETVQGPCSADLETCSCS